MATLAFGEADLVLSGLRGVGLFGSLGGGVQQALDIAAGLDMRSQILANIADTRAGINTTGFPVLEAKISQISTGYLPDQWGMTTLNKGDIIYGGLPGQSGYYTDLSTVLNSVGDKAIFGQTLQIEPHPIMGYRSNIGEYQVLDNMRVPMGIAQANSSLGEGGMTQYFINNYSRVLQLNNEVSFEEFYENYMSRNQFSN